MHLIRSLPPTGAALSLLLIAGPAFAAPTATLTLTPSTPSGAATTCLTVTVTARDGAGAAPTDTPTVTVTISASGTATASFCDPATGASLGPAAATASQDVATSRSTADGPQTAKVGVTSESTGPVSLVAASQQIRSATATATFSDPPPPACAEPPALSVSPTTVVAGQRSTATITGTPGTEVQLYAYSRPATTFLLARQTLVPDSGRLDLPFTPPGSTRLYAVQRSCSEPSPSLVVAVRSPVSVSATRLAPLRYRFAGGTGYAPVGTTVELVNRTAAGDVVLSRTTVGTGGRWSLDRAFLRPADLKLFARTRTTLARLSGTSAVRPTVIA